MYTLFKPCGRLVIQRASFLSSSFAKRLPARCSFILETGKSPTVPGPDCTEVTQRCRNGIAHAARLLSAGQCSDVHCRATKQFHARAFLFYKITYDLTGLQKTNNTSHLTVGGILNRKSHGHRCVYTYHVTRSEVQLHEAILNISLNTRNQ